MAGEDDCNLVCWLVHSADFRLGKDPGLRETKTTWVHRFVQWQTRIRHTHAYTHTPSLSRGPTDSFRLLEAILGILEAGIKVRFQLLLNSISQLLEDMVQCSQISRSQVLSPSRMGCQLIFCFRPAPQLLLLKGMDCAYSNGEGDSTAKSMHYLNGRVMCLGKSFKKKSTL